MAALASATALCTFGIAAGPASAVTGETYSTPGTYEYTVPGGVTSLPYVVKGGNGGQGTPTDPGNVGGLGARISGTLAVTPGQVLYLTVGGNGVDGDPGESTGGGGGGYSSIAETDYDVDPLVVAGGGGGGGYDFADPGPTNRVGGNGGISGGFGGGDGGESTLPGEDGGLASLGGAGATGGGDGGDLGNDGSDAVNDDAGGGGGGFGGVGGLGDGYADFVPGSYSSGGFNAGGDGGFAGGGGGGGYGGGGGGTTEGGGGGGSSLVPDGASASVSSSAPVILLGDAALTAVDEALPPSWYQGYGRAADGSCLEGWTPSWEQWPNGGNGGFVCSRVIFWDRATGSWSGDGSAGLPGGTPTPH